MKLIINTIWQKMIEAGLETGIIYILTCKESGKSYIGQAKDFKYRNFDCL